MLLSIRLDWFLVHEDGVNVVFLSKSVLKERVIEGNEV
jgi:hypothetical protein